MPARVQSSILMRHGQCDCHYPPFTNEQTCLKTQSLHHSTPSLNKNWMLPCTVLLGHQHMKVLISRFQIGYLSEIIYESALL
jgi:hypothetical protein